MAGVSPLALIHGQGFCARNYLYRRASYGHTGLSKTPDVQDDAECYVTLTRWEGPARYNTRNFDGIVGSTSRLIMQINTAGQVTTTGDGTVKRNIEIPSPHVRDKVGLDGAAVYVEQVRLSKLYYYCDKDGSRSHTLEMFWNRRRPP